MSSLSGQWNASQKTVDMQATEVFEHPLPILSLTLNMARFEAPDS